MPLPDSKSFLIEAAEFWSLNTVSSYRQQVKQPQGEYYVGCTFSLDHLPDWFRDEGFLLRELVHLSPDQTAALTDIFSDDWIDTVAPSALQAQVAANALLQCELRIAGQDLEPDGVQIGERGIRWKYTIAGALQEKMREPVEVRISMRTFQPRHQAFFPVNITHPTRHPTVQSTCGQTSLATGDVGANVFFSAEEPYRPELVEHSAEAKRIELHTNRDDWVFRRQRLHVRLGRSRGLDPSARSPLAGGCGDARAPGGAGDG